MLCVASEHVGEPGLRVDFIELGADNQAVLGGSTLAATIGVTVCIVEASAPSF